MKINITGASVWVRRMFEACGRFQWAREFLKNAIEAGATKVEFGIEWQAVAKMGVYRRAVIDDGEGMSRDELVAFFSTLGDGRKKIGGVHDNFGVGAKISSLPWNPNGVVVVTRKSGETSMIWIVLDQDSGDYELSEFQTEQGISCAIDPSDIEWGDDSIDWGSVLPDWVGEHGTAVIMLGSDAHPDTILGNPDEQEGGNKGLSIYLNSRFWNFHDVELTVAEVRSVKKNLWPTGIEDRDDRRRANNRKIKGALYYLDKIQPKEGRLSDSGSVYLDENRVKASWYLWEGKRPNIHMYAKEAGYVAIKYRDELYELSQKKPDFRQFGIIESKVQQHLTIILEPQLFRGENGRWGVLPDQSRNRLVFTGGGDKGVAIPMADWGAEFSDNMPEPILAAINAARGEKEAEIEDDEYRRRLQDKFGSRWSTRVAVKATSKKRTDNLQRGFITESDIEIDDFPGELQKHPRPRKRRNVVHVVKRKIGAAQKANPHPAGRDQVEMREKPVDVPRILFEGSDEFEKPWHLAMFVPNAPGGPAVMINKESPIMLEAIQYHQEQYAPHLGEDVAKTVLRVFGEVAACKVAHSQKLTKDISEEELNNDYRSERALTISLMGLIAEESLIAQRLGKLGRKRSAA